MPVQQLPPANLNLRSASNGYRRTIQFASEFSELSTPLKA